MKKSPCVIMYPKTIVPVYRWFSKSTKSLTLALCQLFSKVIKMEKAIVENKKTETGYKKSKT